MSPETKTAIGEIIQKLKDLRGMMDMPTSRSAITGAIAVVAMYRDAKSKLETHEQ